MSYQGKYRKYVLMHQGPELKIPKLKGKKVRQVVCFKQTSKRLKNGPKWPKMAQNGPKWPKMAKNGPKWLKMAQKPPNAPKLTQL